MNQCVINVAVGSWYPNGQDRLSVSLDKVGFKGGRLFWKDSYPPGCPTHQQTPYAFKVYAFKEALHRGYTHVLWMDSSAWALGNLDSVFQVIDSDGYLLVKNRGWKTGQWCSDDALAPLGITREEAMEMPHLSALVMGLNFKNAVASAFYETWKKLADDGVTFAGRSGSKYPGVLGHRHDQTAASVVSLRLGMKWTPMGQYFDYWCEKPGDSVAILARGM